MASGCFKKFVMRLSMISQGFLCVAGPHVVAPKSPPVVCWPAIGPWQSAIITNHNTTGGDLGATTLGPATHRDPCDM